MIPVVPKRRELSCQDNLLSRNGLSHANWGCKFDVMEGLFLDVLKHLKGSSSKPVELTPYYDQHF